MGKSKASLSSRTSNVVFCGLIVSLMVVSAWVTIPLGPVPVTLQVFAMIFALLFMTPRQYFISLAVYYLIGAVGLPVFSGMRGGIGVFVGPTGGFLWGYLVGALVAFCILFFFKGKKEPEIKKNLNVISTLSKNFIAATAFLVVMYVCGWAQLVWVAGYDPLAAFLIGVAPFVVIDIVKMVAAVFLVEAVKRALPHAFAQTSD